MNLTSILSYPLSENSVAFSASPLVAGLSSMSVMTSRSSISTFGSRCWRSLRFMFRKLVPIVVSMSFVSSAAGGVISMPWTFLREGCSSSFWVISGRGSVVPFSLEMYILVVSGSLRYFGGKYMALPL